MYEIGPRLNFQTAWSTNAVNICKACGIKGIERLEKSTRILIKVLRARCAYFFPIVWFIHFHTVWFSCIIGGRESKFVLRFNSRSYDRVYLPAPVGKLQVEYQTWALDLGEHLQNTNFHPTGELHSFCVSLMIKSLVTFYEVVCYVYARATVGMRVSLHANKKLMLTFLFVHNKSSCTILWLILILSGTAACWRLHRFA